MGGVSNDYRCAKTLVNLVQAKGTSARRFRASNFPSELIPTSAVGCDGVHWNSIRMTEFYVNATFSLARESIDESMDKPVQQHMEELERRIQWLSKQIMRNGTSRRQRNRIESELRVVQQALELYRNSIELAERIRGNERKMRPPMGA